MQKEMFVGQKVNNSTVGTQKRPSRRQYYDKGLLFLVWSRLNSLNGANNGQNYVQKFIREYNFTLCREECAVDVEVLTG